MSADIAQALAKEFGDLPDAAEATRLDVRLSRGEIRGLTTVATIWVTAAIGMTAGLGQLVTAIVATVIVLVVLVLLPRVEPQHGRGDTQPEDHAR